MLAFHCQSSVDPEDQHQWLHLTLAQEHPLEGVERALAALRWIELHERAVLRQSVEGALASPGWLKLQEGAVLRQGIQE